MPDVQAGYLNSKFEQKNASMRTYLLRLFIAFINCFISLRQRHERVFYWLQGQIANKVADILVMFGDHVFFIFRNAVPRAPKNSLDVTEYL